jgi:hypothetical protein
MQMETAPAVGITAKDVIVRCIASWWKQHSFWLCKVFLEEAWCQLLPLHSLNRLALLYLQVLGLSEQTMISKKQRGNYKSVGGGHKAFLHHGTRNLIICTSLLHINT